MDQESETFIEATEAKFEALNRQDVEVLAVLGATLVLAVIALCLTILWVSYV